MCDALFLLSLTAQNGQNANGVLNLMMRQSFAIEKNDFREVKQFAYNHSYLGKAPA